MHNKQNHYVQNVMYKFAVIPSSDIFIFGKLIGKVYIHLTLLSERITRISSCECFIQALHHTDYQS